MTLQSDQDLMLKLGSLGISEKLIRSIDEEWP